MSDALTREKRPYIWLEEYLEDPEILKPPTHVVPRIVWVNRLTMLAAREKGGKSTLAGAVAAAVSSGSPFLGQDCLAGNVLVVSLEEHPQEFVQRLMRFGADPKKVAIVQGGSQNIVAEIRAAAEEVNPVLIIWDTLGAFARYVAGKDLEPNDSQGWTRVMQEILDITRDFGASLLLHHSNKADGRYRDSTAIGANVDVIIEMFGEGSETRTLKTVARFPTDEFRIKLEDDGFRMIESEKEFEARVLRFIGLNPRCGMRELADGVQGKTSDVSRIRDKLLKAGKIANVGTHAKHEYMATGR